MTIHTRFTVLLTLSMLALLPGCRSRSCLRPSGGCPTCTAPTLVPGPSPLTTGTPAPIAFPGSTAAAPAAPLPAPPAALPLPSAPNQVYRPANPPSTTYSTSPPPLAQTPGPVQLGSPAPMNGQTDQDDPLRPLPQAPAAPTPPRVDEAVTKAPTVYSSPAPAGAFPVGIPEFAIVKDGVAAGLRPMLDGGLDWLQRQGYRTVLHLRTPGTDDEADRKQVEKRGLTYLSLEVTPQTLNPQTVEEFIRLVSDPSRAPLFVYDRDGSLSGGLWYLYFRQQQGLADEDARVRAGSLGLRPDRSPAHRQMWQAVQNYWIQKGR